MIDKRELEIILKQLYNSYSEAFDYNTDLYMSLKSICGKYNIKHSNIINND